MIQRCGFVSDVVWYSGWLGLHLLLALALHWVDETKAGLGWSFIRHHLPWPASFFMPLCNCRLWRAGIYSGMLPLSHHIVSGQNNFNKLYHIWVLLTIRLPVAFLPSCVWDTKNSAHLPGSRYLKIVLKNGSICISLYFASQKETKVLSEVLHDMKEENKLLKQKNASMIRKQEHYECEISRLNKVWARVEPVTRTSSFNSRISDVKH